MKRFTEREAEVVSRHMEFPKHKHTTPFEDFAIMVLIVAAVAIMLAVWWPSNSWARCTSYPCPSWDIPNDGSGFNEYIESKHRFKEQLRLERMETMQQMREEMDHQRRMDEINSPRHNVDPYAWD